MTHDIKSWCQFFPAVLRGTKRAEIRVLDRDYQVGDILLMREYDPLLSKYTGRQVSARITHIISDRHGHCAFSPSVLSEDYGVLSIEVL